ncbi:cation diffusion facilitator family transporter [Thermodesulfovibrio sp. 3907-1M]|uniref:Cation diffusion facilitator family transporter n=1 Tax=Thermodesulfovibrio autotrophicus TaxID=3118333 RepID=A0AAU8GX07_9BACT
MKQSSTKKLSLAVGITFFIFIVEVIGGLISNSLALFSDAGHVFTDAFALILSLLASIITKKPSGRKATYGYHKIGILAAFINGVSLIVIAGLIFFEGYQRLLNPPKIDSDIMLPVAVFGFLGNLMMAWILGHRHEDLNIKSAWLHVIGDTISSAGVIIAGLIIKYTGWLTIDPIISWFVGFIIITGGVRVIKDSLWIFLDFVPEGFDVEEITEKIKKIKGIIDVHDIHIWSIGYGVPAFSAHVVVDNQLLSEADKIRKKIEEKLGDIGIKHSVIQIECIRCENSSIYCNFGNHKHH